jgi:hypothetical protein
VTNAPAIPTQSLTPELATGVNKINLADTANLIRPETGPGNILTGMSRAVQEPGKFVDYLGGGWEATKKVGLPLAGVVMGGLEESDLYPTVAYGTAAASYPNVDPVTGALRLGYDTGLRLKPTYAAEGGEIKSYAIGGNVGNPSVGGGLSDLYNRPEGQALENISNDGYGIGRLNSLAAQESLNSAKTLGYAEGGSLNLNELPTLNTVTGEQIPAGIGVSGKQLNPLGQIFHGMMSMGSLKPNISDDKSTQELFYSPHITWGTNPETQNFRRLVNTGSYAHGGYLDGQGDGMSDSIPATIEGKQPARLADGEFVVPADVVSHLGNGYDGQS